MGQKHLRFNQKIYSISAHSECCCSGVDFDRSSNTKAVSIETNPNVVDKPHNGHIGFFSFGNITSNLKASKSTTSLKRRLYHF
jgi:hypothetical protein